MRNLNSESGGSFLSSDLFCLAPVAGTTFKRGLQHGARGWVHSQSLPLEHKPQFHTQCRAPFVDPFVPFEPYKIGKPFSEQHSPP